MVKRVFLISQTTQQYAEQHIIEMKSIFPNGFTINHAQAAMMFKGTITPPTIGTAIILVNGATQEIC